MNQQPRKVPAVVTRFDSGRVSTLASVYEIRTEADDE